MEGFDPEAVEAFPKTEVGGTAELTTIDGDADTDLTKWQTTALVRGNPTPQPAIQQNFAVGSL